MAAGRGIIESVADLRILYPIPDFALKYSAIPLKPDRTAIATGRLPTEAVQERWT